MLGFQTRITTPFPIKPAAPQAVLDTYRPRLKQYTNRILLLQNKIIHSVRRAGYYTCTQKYFKKRRCIPRTTL